MPLIILLFDFSVVVKHLILVLQMQQLIFVSYLK